MNMREVCENVQELRKMLEGCGSPDSSIYRLIFDGVGLDRYLEALDIVEGHLRARIEEVARIEAEGVTSVPEELEAPETIPI